MQIILFIISLIIYFLLALLPYYVAYLIIEPHSFWATVGVFVLGSVIVPVTIFVASITIAFISGITGKIVNRKSPYNQVDSQEMRTVNADMPTKKKSRIILIILVFAIVGMSAFLILLFIEERNNAYQVQQTSAYEEPNTTPFLEMNESSDKTDYSEDTPTVKYASSLGDDYNLMKMAVQKVITTVEAKGIPSIAREIRDCYVNSNSNSNSNSNTLYCAYLDHSAKLLDTALSNTYKFPRDEYLYDARVIERAYKYLYQPNHIVDHIGHSSKIESELKVILKNALISKSTSGDKDGAVQNPVPQQVSNSNLMNESNRLNTPNSAMEDETKLSEEESYDIQKNENNSVDHDLYPE